MEYPFSTGANQVEAYDSPKMARRETTRMELTRRISELETYLGKQKELLQLLDENPVIEKFMDLSRG